MSELEFYIGLVSLNFIESELEFYIGLVSLNFIESELEFYIELVSLNFIESELKFYIELVSLNFIESELEFYIELVSLNFIKSELEFYIGLVSRGQTNVAQRGCDPGISKGRKTRKINVYGGGGPKTKKTNDILRFSLRHFLFFCVLCLRTFSKCGKNNKKGQKRQRT